MGKSCELCMLERKTHWYEETDEFVVCDCTICGVPQVVLREHTMAPSSEVLANMEDVLSVIAQKFYKGDGFVIDKAQRKISDHLHWHARPALRYMNVSP